MSQQRAETQLIEFAAIATSWHPNPSLVDEMLAAFRDELDEPAPFSHLIGEVTRTFDRHRIGIWLDHNEEHQAFQSCSNIISQHVLESDSYLNWEGEHTDAEWTGAGSPADAEEALWFFNEWLKSNSGLTLVQIRTSSDFYFCVVVEQSSETRLVKWLSDANVNASGDRWRERLQAG